MDIQGLKVVLCKAAFTGRSLPFQLFGEYNELFLKLLNNLIVLQPGKFGRLREITMATEPSISNFPAVTMVIFVSL